MRPHFSLPLSRGVFQAIVVALIVQSFSATLAGQQGVIIGNSFAGSPKFGFDANGAVGPNHYAEITNNEFRVTAITNGTVVYNSSLVQFWTSKVLLFTSPNVCCDSHLEYDHATGRWFAISISGPGSVNSAVLVGVSDTSDPSATWKGLVIEADPAHLRWADYPLTGIDAAAIYIRLNMIGIASTTEQQTALFVLPKADLTGTIPVTSHLSRFTVAAGHTQPQVDYSGTASDGLQMGEILQSSTRDDTGSSHWIFTNTYQKLTSQASGSAILTPLASTAGFQFDSTINPPPVSDWGPGGHQPGTSQVLGRNYGKNNIRIGDSVYSVAVAGVKGHSGLAWTRFQPSTNTIVDAGFIGNDTHDYLDLSVAANKYGDVVIAYTRSSPAEYASLYCSVGIPDANGKLIFGQPLLLKAGTDIYDESGPRYGPTGPARFSDYSSAVSVHPSNPSHFWISGAYVGGRNVASTWIAEIIVDPLVVSQPTEFTLSQKSLTFSYRKGDAAPAAQIISVTSKPTGGPFSATTFTAGGGNWLSVSPASGTAPGAVTVSLNNITLTNIGAGTYTGIVTIAGIDVPVTLIVSRAAPPVITPGGVVPVYGTTTTIQPGSWISIYGTNLAASTEVWKGDFPVTLGGVSVTVNGRAGYLWFVSPTQINLQAPDDISTGPANVVVTTPTGSSTATVTLTAASPSFSLLDVIHAAALTLNADGTYDIVGPVGAFAYPTRPVAPGAPLILYGVGFGPTDPPVKAGQTATATAAITNRVTVTIGGVPAAVAYAGIVAAGLYQLNVTVPDGLASGDQPLRATVSGVQTRSGPVVTIR